MKTEIKMAVGLTTAKTNKLHCKPYLKVVPLSSLKEQIGQLLLYLQLSLNETDKQNCWQWLETILRKYIDLKLSEAQR